LTTAGDHPERGVWGSRLGFLLAAIGSAVGLGNIWRFPYMAYSNGGGAFLIPYAVAFLTVGLPLLLLEFGLGHRTGKSAPHPVLRQSGPDPWLAAIAAHAALTPTRTP